MSVLRVLFITAGETVEERLTASLEGVLEGTGVSVKGVSRFEDALEIVDDEPIDCVVSEYLVGGTTVLSELPRLRERHPSLPFILFADADSPNAVRRAVDAGVTDYVRTGDDPAAYEILAHRITVAVDQASNQVAADRLAQSTNALSQLYEMTNQTDLSFEEKLDGVLEIGATALDYPIGYITRLEGRSLEIIAAAGDHEEIQSGETNLLKDTFCRATVETNAPVIVTDAATDEQWNDAPAYTELGLQCYVGSRIIVDGEVFGSLCFAAESARDRSLMEALQPTVKTLAQWVGSELERTRYERELKRQIDRLEEFTGVVSHDLRNPLNIAQGRLDLARGECGSEHLQTVEIALERMEAIIEDTLTLARQGQTVAEKEPVDITTVIDRSWRVVETGASELRQVDEFTVLGDCNRLYQIFENLFRNAVEHSPRPVTIRIGLLDFMYTSTRVETDGTFGFYVEDDGPGIPENRRERVFEPGESTRKDGTGFGLSIVKRIAEAHGWEVKLTESFDGGARFEFSNVR